MNLISCKGCGVVLDANNLHFPEDIYDYGGCVKGDKAIWNGNEWVAAVPCPVCATVLAKENK